MFQITFQYTLNDLARGNHFILKRRLWWTKYANAYCLLTGAGMIVFGYAQPALDWRTTFVIIGLVTLLIPLAWLVLLKGFAKQMAKQIFRNNPHVHHPQTYGFEDENLTITGELFEANLKWPALVKAAETDTDFFLFITKDQAYVLPKRFFKTGEEVELRSFLKTKLGERAKLN
jgi:hypothetical protein